MEATKKVMEISPSVAGVEVPGLEIYTLANDPLTKSWAAPLEAILVQKPFTAAWLAGIRDFSTAWAIFPEDVRELNSLFPIRWKTGDKANFFLAGDIIDKIVDCYVPAVELYNELTGSSYTTTAVVTAEMLLEKWAVLREAMK